LDEEGEGLQKSQSTRRSKKDPGSVQKVLEEWKYGSKRSTGSAKKATTKKFIADSNKLNEVAAQEEVKI